MKCCHIYIIFLFLICLFFLSCDNKDKDPSLDGLDITIQTEEKSFYPNQTVTVTVNLSNSSNNVFSCDPREHEYEIEIDGKWYQWGGSVGWDTFSQQVKPNQKWDNFTQIKMTKQWVSKETGKPLILDVGSHTIKFRYSPNFAKPYRSGDKPVRVTSTATSNLLDVKIISQDKTPIPGENTNK